jgi:hypothetical protein
LFTTPSQKIPTLCCIHKYLHNHMEVNAIVIRANYQ